MPKLRFRGFEDGWKKEPIGNYINLFSGVALKGEEISEEQGGIPILRGINITEGFIRHNEKIDRFYHGEISGLENLLIQEGDLVLGMDGSKVGKNSAIVSAIDVGAILIQRVACLRPKKNGSIEFVFHHIHSSRFHQYVDVVNTSSGIPHISSKQIKDFRIWFPTLPEQQKIAGFLSAVDEKLQHLSRKKELLQQYKKGVMQKLFAQELRFKREDGSDYEDWEEKRLGEVCGNIGYGMNAAAKAFDGRNQYLRITDIDENSRMFDKSSVTSPEGELTDNYLLKEGDLLFARTGASVGKSYLYNPKDGIVYFAGFLIRFRVKKANALFVYYQTRSYKYDKWVRVMSMRSGQPGINAEEYKLFKMKLPCLEEQQKIADFLSSLDKKIEAVSAQIELTQQFKKGLLQEMFV